MGREMIEPKKRGFAAMSPEKRREVSAKGGSASPGYFAANPDAAKEAGRKGGSVSKRKTLTASK